MDLTEAVRRFNAGLPIHPDASTPESTEQQTRADRDAAITAALHRAVAKAAGRINASRTAPAAQPDQGADAPQPSSPATTASAWSKAIQRVTGKRSN
jgi:hypothetical protein